MSKAHTKTRKAPKPRTVTVDGKKVALPDHMKSIAASGGKSRSARKLLAVQRNLAKAMIARYPKNREWQRTFKRLDKRLKKLTEA